MIRKPKKNVAGYIDEVGRFRPIRKPSFVGTPKRRATPKDRKKYSRAKAGDLGVAAQEKATGVDFFAKEARKEKQAWDRTRKRIERETLGEADELDSGRTLVEFVRDKGGIRPTYKFGGKANRGKRISYDAGELAPLTYKESGKRGLVSEKGKLTLDGMHQAAREAGYDIGDINDLINRLDDEIRGGKVTYATRGFIDYRDNPAGELPKGTRFKRRRNRGDLFVVEDTFGTELGHGFTKEEAIAKARKNLARVLTNRRSRRRAATPKAGQGRLFNPKTNGVLVGDRKNKSDLYVTQLGPRSFGVFLKTYLLKKFSTKAAADSHVRSIQTKAKKNPINIFGVVAAVSGVQSALQINEMLKKKKPVRRKTRAKVNPSGKTTAKVKNPPFAAGMFGVPKGGGDEVMIYETPDLKTPLTADEKRKLKAIATQQGFTKIRFTEVDLGHAPNFAGTVRRGRRNPHGDMPSGARFNEKLFDQDLAAIEDGNFRLIRSAKAHGRLAGYKTPEIDRLVQRARLAFQLKEMYRRKENPADVAKLLAPIKANGAFKRMLQRRKAASALKRELKLEAALEKTRAKKRKAIAAATNPTRSRVVKKAATRSAKPKTNAAPSHKEWLDMLRAKRQGLLTFKKKYPERARSAVFRDEWNDTNKRIAALKKNIRKAKANPRASAKKPPRSRTFEMFQGRPVTNAVKRPISRHAPAKVAQLGDLIEIKLVGMTPIKLNPSKAKLTAANGRLWIAGQRFAKPSASAAANEINPIGEIDHVVYGTRKPHHGDHAYTHYIHKLGEDSGKRPLLCVDKEGFAVIRGGNYKIEARGIVD